MDEQTNFEKLASGISQDERKSMLEKIGGPTIIEDVTVDGVPIKKAQGKTITVAERFKKESIFLRLLLWIKSLFRGTTPLELYKSLRVDRIIRATESQYRDLINRKTETISGSFYEKLLQVKNAADFFAPYLILVEKDNEEYLGFLGSVVFPNIAEEIDKNCNPYSMPFNTPPTNELRVSYFHKLDEILDAIDSEKKAEMYLSVKTSAWFREFAAIPYDNILRKFSGSENGMKSCKYGDLEGDINILAKVFCNVPTFPREVFKAIFYFEGRNASEGDNQSEGEENFIQNAENQIAMIKMFITTVPLNNLGKIISDDADWRAPTFGGGEDWFINFKSQCKVTLDKKWEAWIRDCQKEGIREKFSEFYGIEKFPLLPNRPWASMEKDFPYNYELTGGFLCWFFQNVFPKVDVSLKTVMVEGDFAKKENRVVFTDAYNDFSTANTIMNTLVKRLEATGEFGQGFQKLTLVGIRSAQGKTKLQSMLSLIETDVDSAIKKFGNAARQISPIIKGFFSAAKDKVYGPLTNFMLIRGKDNEEFRMGLENARKQIDTAYDFLTRLEPIDKVSDIL